MSRFSLGQVIYLKSDSRITGAIINIDPNARETIYQVFTAEGIQRYYESQIDLVENRSDDPETVSLERFHASMTASIIRNPSISSLYSLNSAQIDFIPHQFRPVLKFIKSDRPRMLIADGVGVGKTIEAGLILKELEARRNLDSILIICPRPLISERKWEQEMNRFGEEFVPLDGGLFRQCISEMNLDGEWPERYKRAIIPYSLFDEGNVFGNSLHPGLYNVDPPKFDLVIIDEAHHIRNTATYAYRAISRFCEAAEAVIMLTATPVQLEDTDLYVLLNLLRPDLIIDKKTFHDMAEPNAFINTAASVVRGYKDNWQEEAAKNIIQAMNTSWGRKVFQNNPLVLSILKTLSQTSVSLQERVQLISDIEGLHTFSNIISRTRRRDIGEFTIRKPHTVTVDFTPEQRELHDRILEVVHRSLSSVHCTENTKFMMTTIRRQTASCLFGLMPMLDDILYRHSDEILDDEDNEIEYMRSARDSDLSSIDEQIKEIQSLAKAMPKDDPKLDALIQIIEEKGAEPKNKVMVFSSFKHTLRYLEKKLSEHGIRVGLVHGEVPDEERRELRRRFNPEETSNTSPKALDVLLFSEVGCEGLDYQFCDCMINYDLPWNPMKIEQRIGRIDRNGQTSESVAIYNLVTPGTVDADIYERCMLRIGVFNNSIGDSEEILGNISKDIQRAANDFTLTDEERKEKLQQIADNEIRRFNIQRELEEKQRDLFGIQVPDQEMDKDLKDATNFWLSSTNIQNLVTCYLKSRFGDKEYIVGSKTIKRLRLSQDVRAGLVADFKESNFPRNEINRTWRKWLDSGEISLNICFEGDGLKEDPKATLLSVVHPLVKMAAAYLQSKDKLLVSLTVKTDDIPKGEYPFSIYQWKLSGEREDLQMVPVSYSESLNQILLELLEHSSENPMHQGFNETRWKGIEDAHHDIWMKALEEHRAKTIELVAYKEASLKTSQQARIASLQDRLNNDQNDKKYVQMITGQLRAAEVDYENRMAELEKAKNQADILFDLLAYGLLKVTN